MPTTMKAWYISLGIKYWKSQITIFFPSDLQTIMKNIF